MNVFVKYTLFLLLVLGVFAVLLVPYGLCYNTETALIEHLSPTEVNLGFDPLAGFCLYAPILILIESFFMKVPFKRWQNILMILQFIGVLITLPFALFVPLGIPFGHADPYPFTIFILCWTFSVLLWQLFLMIPDLAKYKWVSWPFNRR